MRPATILPALSIEWIFFFILLLFLNIILILKSSHLSGPYVFIIVSELQTNLESPRKHCIAAAE